MTSTIGDIGIWAASMSGSSLLSPSLAAERIASPQTISGIYDYGLGILRLHGTNTWGHEGEAIGWEGFEGMDPDSGIAVVTVLNGCGVLEDVLSVVGALNPDAKFEQP